MKNMETNYKEKLINIKAFIFDVDGVLTDGSLLISESGELLRSMNVKDGFAMKFAIDNGYKIGIISGGSNKAVKTRLAKLGIEEIHLKSHDKIIHFNNFLKKYNLQARQYTSKNISNYDRNFIKSISNLMYEQIIDYNKYDYKLLRELDFIHNQ